MAKIIDKEVNEELSESYLKYAGYVLQNRAIPDSRDCLKDGARKILWSMLTNKHTYDKGMIKGQAATGEVMKYSVHGDASIYGTMVRMAQPFALRYPLVYSESNIGSVFAGSDYAAGRYVELKLSKIADDMLKNIDKETVTWKKNYDETKLMPTVLPAFFPNFVNGATGIGVGAACSIPQFNIGEVCDALTIMIEKNGFVNFEEIYCPIDFATGAIIVNELEVKNSLKNGTGTSAKVRAIIEYDEGKNQLIVKELPYQVYTDTICLQLADNINKGNITQVDSYFDGTNINGVNIVLNLVKKANIKKAFEELYKNTSLENHFSVNMIMLKEGKTPEVFGWEKLLTTYIKHLKDIISKSHQFDYNKLQEKIHINEGYLKALEHIDNIIILIKTSENTADARKKLILNYSFSEAQANSILDLKLQRLTKLEAVEINKKLNEYKTEAAYHHNIFSNVEELKKETIREIGNIKKKYNDARRTKNINISLEDETIQIEEKNIIAYISNKGAIVAKEVDNILIQRRNTIGSKVKFSGKNDVIWKTIVGSTKDNLLLFTNKGHSYTLSLSSIPIDSELYMNQLVELSENEYVTNVLPYDTVKNYKYVIFATKNGTVKKTCLSEYISSARKKGLAGIKLKEGDELISTQLIENDSDTVLLATKQGNCLLVNQEDFSATGRVTMGVKGIELKKDDKLVSMQVINNNSVEILSITAQGYGKRTSIEEFSTATRATKGNSICKFKEENDYLADVVVISNKHTELIANSKVSSLKLAIDTVPLQGRATIGLSIINVTNNLVKNLILLEN